MEEKGDFAGLVEDIAKVASSKAYLKIIGDLSASGHFVTPSEERALELAGRFTAAFAGAFAEYVADNRGLLKDLLFPTPGEDLPKSRFSFQ